MPYPPGRLAAMEGESTHSFSLKHSGMAVGIAGTFDVENYGDLLFPLIASVALKRHDPRIQIVPFSVNSRSRTSWPFQVRPMEELTASIAALSALLIGGGQIVRFDKRYPIPVPTHADMPVAYWLVPAAQASLAGKPVIWNAVGALTGSPRLPGYDALLRQVFAASYFIGVRDIASRDYLAQLAPDADIEFLPDTAFGLSRLWPLHKEESVEFKNWRRSLGLDGKYVVIQASAAVGAYHSQIESLLRSMGMVNIVILPVCWCHGDRAEAFPKIKGRVFLSPEWLAPQLISEIIGRSEFVFASSLHACITALSYGVPGTSIPSFRDRKYELLDEFEGIVQIEQKDALARLIHRDRGIEPRSIQYADRLDHYWAGVADVVLHPPLEHGAISQSLMLGWVAKMCGDQDHIGFMRRSIMSLRESLARRFPGQHAVVRRRIHSLKNLVAAPFRWTDRAANPTAAGAAPESNTSAASMQAHTNGNGNGTGSLAREAGYILNLHQIAEKKMETDPYQWAFIDHLFSMEDAAQLATSFPCDKFKKVKGYDGEKSYEYMARSLVHMGATAPSHSDGLSRAWQALADDLLSPEYRSALARITGRDLTSAVMEVNVVHYGPGAYMGPHLDLREKLITHVLYFNQEWDQQHGGCINILRSSNPADVLTRIQPVVGNSVLLVRSNRSWHSVSRVARDCRTSRRSINVIFHLPGSVSTMWPPSDKPALMDYSPAS